MTDILKHVLPFRRFDVRGTFGETVDRVRACAIGYGFAKATGAKMVALAGDTGPHSDEIREGVAAGIRAAGAHTHEISSALTLEQTCYLVGSQYMEGGVYVTGGTGGPNVTGMKFIGPDCEPLPPALIQEIKKHASGPLPQELPDLSSKDCVTVVVRGYHDFIASVLEPFGEWPPEPEPFRVILDPGTSTAMNDFDLIRSRMDLPSNIKFYSLNEIDGGLIRGVEQEKSDPLHPERVERMQMAITTMQADLGLAWSGDGSRLVAHPEAGGPIHGAHLGAYLAAAVGQRYPGEAMISDQRVAFPMMSTCMGGGNPYGIALPGRTHMQNAMRQGNATFGADCEGRYYFRDLWWSESGQLAAFLMLHMAYLTPMPLGQVIRDLESNFAIDGEHRMVVDDAPAQIEQIAKRLEEGKGETHNYELVDGEIVVRSLDKMYDWRAVIRPDEDGNLCLTLEGRLGAAQNFLQGLVAKIKEWVGG